MLKRIVTKIVGRGRHDKSRRDRANQLLSYLDDNGTIILDRDGLRILGINRKQAFQTVYDLVMHEEAQMRATEDGQVVVMSNQAFERWMEERAQSALTVSDNRKSRTTNIAGRKGNAGRQAEKPAARRQILPERLREPWIALENIGIDYD